LRRGPAACRVQYRREKSVRGRKIVEGALDLLYPPRIYCDICGNLIDESRTYALCDRCISRMKWDRDPVQELGGVKMLRCAEYGIYERTMIFNLKYRGRKYIARDIAEIMRDRLRITDAVFEVIVPVPLSPERLRARGFNQTALIGRHLAEMTGTVQVEDALVRARNTRPMHGLSPEEREENIRGAFRVNTGRIPELSGRRILMLEIKRRVSIQSNDLRKPLISRGFRHMRLCIGEARAGFMA